MKHFSDIEIPGRYHIVGVAGVGMSAVAQVLKGVGCEVTGSDRFLDQGESLEELDLLEAGGIRLAPQDGSGISVDTAGIVVSTAIEMDNSDVQRAVNLGVPVIHRAEMLARLTAGHRCIAVTGTAGKTTVTGMAGYILEQAGLNPTVVNGGVVVNWRNLGHVGNVRMGTSDLWLIEADESDRSLLHFSPEMALITNMSKDHFELCEVVELFQEFSARVTKRVLCGRGVCERLGSPCAEEIEGEVLQREDEWFIRIDGIEIGIPLLGRHNAENAIAAVALCKRIGVDIEEAGRALRSFLGIARRLEVVDAKEGVCVIDDYGHNPVKLAAAWRAVSERSRRIIGVWRPHGFGPLRLMFDELAECFLSVCRDRDRLFLLPVFYAGGKAEKEVTSDDLVARLQAGGLQARGVQGYAELLPLLRAEVKEGDTVLVMGARDPGLPRFARSFLRT